MAMLRSKRARGFLVDDPGHEDDLIQRVTTVYELANKPSPDSGELRSTVAATSSQLTSRCIRRAVGKRRSTGSLPPHSELLGLAIHSSPQQGHDISESRTTMLRRSLLTNSVNLKACEPTPDRIRAASQRKADREHRKPSSKSFSVFLDEVKRVAPLWNPISTMASC